MPQNNSPLYYTVYAERANISFVMKEGDDEDGLGIVTVAGFYFGEPDRFEDNEIIENDKKGAK